MLKETKIIGKIVFYILFFLTAFISCFACIFNNKMENGFEYIAIFPVVYILFAMIIFLQLKLLKKNKSKGMITIYTFLILQWLRLVLLPLVGSISGYFQYYNFFIDEKSLYTSTLLILLETVFTFLLCIVIIYYSKSSNNYPIKKFKMLGNKYIYFIFIFISFILFVFYGRNQYSFFVIPLSKERLSSSILIRDGSISTSIIDYGLSFFVINYLFWCYKKYRINDEKRYLYLALVGILFRLCLISSEGRMSQIYLTGTFLLLLPQLFPKYKKKIIRGILIVSFAVVGLMTVYKVFAAFLYDSYYEAIKQSSFELKDTASQIDIYFYGIKTIARNVFYLQQSGLGVFHSIFDILRNTFGLHYFFKGMDYTTLEYYNLFLYNGQSTSGHLFSSIAYGYQYFGLLLAPLCTCFNLVISLFIERSLKKIKYIELYYIVSIIFIRVSLSIFSNFSQTWNVVSRTFIIGMIVIGSSSLFTKRLWKGGTNL